MVCKRACNQQYSRSLLHCQHTGVSGHIWAFVASLSTPSPFPHVSYRLLSTAS